MIPFRKSLAFRTLLVTFILLPLPLLVDSFVYLHSRYKENVKSAKEFLVKYGKTRIFLSSRALQLKGPTFTLLESYLHLKDKFPESSSEALTASLQKSAMEGQFTAIVLLRAENNFKYAVIGTSFVDDPKNHLFSNTFYENLIAAKGSAEEFSAIYQFSPGFYYLVSGRKVLSSTGQVLGALILVSDISSDLKELVAKRSFMDDSIEFAILKSDMVVIASTDPKLQYQYFFPLPSSEIERLKREDIFPQREIQNTPLSVSFEEGNSLIAFTWQGTEKYGQIDAIPRTPFFFLTYTSKSAIFFKPMAPILKDYLIYGIILLVGGILAFFMTLRIAKPLQNLSVTMVGIQKGNLNLRYKRDKLGFEINFLGQTFNTMVDTLLEKQNAAEEERIKTEAYDKELRIGQQVQRSLLPEIMPQYPGVEIAARYLPAKEVGGDFYDVFTRTMGDKNELVLVVADGSGKGVQACFYSFGLRSHLRTFAKEYSSLSEIGSAANALFAKDCGQTGMFVTTFMAIYDAKTKQLTWSSAGHNPAFIRHVDGSVDVLDKRVMAFGVDETMEVTHFVSQLRVGDLVVFYTDGVTDNQNEAGAFFSEERLFTFIKDRGHKNAAEVAEELLNEVKAFQGEASQYDDITLLLMKVL